MNFLASPLGVFLILAFVAIVAFSYEPKKYIGAWQELSERYGTNDRPASIAFPGESIEVDDRSLYDFTSIDVHPDQDGLWLLYAGPDPKKAPDCLFLPWDCVRYRQEKRGRQNFQFRGKDPIDVWVSPELGDAMQKRSLRFTVEDEL